MAHQQLRTPTPSSRACVYDPQAAAMLAHIPSTPSSSHPTSKAWSPAKLTVRRPNPLYTMLRFGEISWCVGMTGSPQVSHMFQQVAIMSFTFIQFTSTVTKMMKTQFYPIQHDETNLDFLINAGQPISTFPCTYLGLPLNIRNPSKSMLIPLVQKIGNHLLGWKIIFVSYPERKMLVKTLLCFAHLFHNCFQAT
jgi:hypothetical protein